MAISLKTAGTWARVVTDPSSVSIPGTPAAGNRMFLFANWKTFSITVADPAGWTPIVNAFASGAVAAGNGSGSVALAGWYRDWQSGDGNPSLDWSSAPTEAHAVIQLWQKGAGDVWGTPLFATAAIASADPFTATATQALAITDGSVVMCMIALADDSTTIARSATTAIEDDGSPDVTWNGNYVESPATHFNSTTGLDMSGDLGHRFVTTGAAGVNLTTTGDPAAAETGGALWVVQGLAAPVTGTGGIDLDAPAASGAGKETMSGTAAVGLDSPSVAASGKQSFVGAGAAAITAPSVAGSGDVGAGSISGEGAVTIAAPALAAAGLERITGAAASVLQAPAVAVVAVQAMVGSAAVAIGAPMLEAAGAEHLTGAGAFTIAAPAVAAVGGEVIAGSGAVSIAAPGIAGSGAHTVVPVTGTGALAIAAPGVSVIGSGGTAVVAAPTRHAARRGPRHNLGPGLGRPTPITARGGASIGAPAIRGVGRVNDDELALRLLLAAA